MAWIGWFLNENCYLCAIEQVINIMGKDINRIKVILVEKKRTNKWLAEQLGKDPAYCLQMVHEHYPTEPWHSSLKIAELLNVQIQELVRMPE